MASTDARPVPLKNTAYRHYFALRLTTGALVSTATGMDTEVSKDGAAFADATNEWTEIGTTGIGYIDLTATEMNADSVIIQTKYTNTNNMTAVEVLFPQEAGDIPVNLTYWNGTAVAAPDTAGYPKVTVKAGTGTGEMNLSTGALDANLARIAGVALLTGSAQSGSATSMRGQSGQSAYPGDVIWTTGGATPARVTGAITAVSGNGTSSPDWTVGGGFNGTAPGSGTNYVILPKDGLVAVDGSLLATAAQAVALLARLPALLVGGRLDVSIGAYQTGLIPLMAGVQGRTLNVDASGVGDANLSKFRGAVSQGTGAPGDNIRPVGIDPS